MHWENLGGAGGEGGGMGNTCKPMAVSFQCMTKFTTSKKKLLSFKKFMGSVVMCLLSFITFVTYVFFI